MPLSPTLRYWFIVPAAGVGARMNADRPKQYLLLANKTILEHTLSRILNLPHLAGVVVPIGVDDSYWSSLSIFQHPLVHTVQGGESRAVSVLNGLNYLANKIHDQDWVLVHDAARPCVTISSIQKLCSELAESETGGILAVPVSDTIKQVVDGAIHATVDRKPFWQAQTPQMFRYKLLRDSLTQSLAEKQNITDESSAIELCGYKSIVVEGSSDNIKVTRPDDLVLAEFILKQQEKNS